MKHVRRIVVLIVLRLLSLFITPVLTTTNASAVPSIEKIVSTYDAGSMHVNSNNVFRVSEVSGQPVPSFGQVAGFLAALLLR